MPGLEARRIYQKSSWQVSLQMVQPVSPQDCRDLSVIIPFCLQSGAKQLQVGDVMEKVTIEKAK